MTDMIQVRGNYTKPEFLIIHTRPDEIAGHYRKLVLCLHPDKNPHEGAKDAFTAVQQAMEQVIN